MCRNKTAGCLTTLALLCVCLPGGQHVRRRHQASRGPTDSRTGCVRLACGLHGRLRGDQRPDRVRACSQRRLSSKAPGQARCLLARAAARAPAAHQVPEAQPGRVLRRCHRTLPHNPPQNPATEPARVAARAPAAHQVPEAQPGRVLRRCHDTLLQNPATQPCHRALPQNAGLRRAPLLPTRSLKRSPDESCAGATGVQNPDTPLIRVFRAFRVGAQAALPLAGRSRACFWTRAPASKM